MRTLNLFFIILLITASITSCNSDDNKSATVYPEENPLAAYLSASGFNQKEFEVKNDKNMEVGISFKPKVKGRINAFIVKIPDINPALRVTLWDFETRKVIKSEIINVTAANTTVEKVIIPIALEKNKEYFLTVNTNDWITRTKINESAIQYPIEAGNITITTFGWVSSIAEELLFPRHLMVTMYAGDFTFKFQQTE